jgi:hypothetical protein
VLGRTLISGGSTTQHHRDGLGADALTTLPNASRFSCAVPLPSRAGSFLLVSRSIGAGYLVARRLFPDIRPALLLAAALAPTDARGMDSPVIKGNERPGVDLQRDQEREFISGFGTGDSWQVADSDS